MKYEYPFMPCPLCGSTQLAPTFYTEPLNEGTYVKELEVKCFSCKTKFNLFSSPVMDSCKGEFLLGDDALDKWNMRPGGKEIG